MNNRFLDGCWPHGIGVVFAAALNFTVAAHAAPRETDEAAHRPGNNATDATRLVTGDPARIIAVVAGSPPTAILAVTPVQPPVAAAPVNSYPAGCTIVGQELRCDRNDNAGFRAWFNMQLSGWDPAGNGPNARIYQFKMDCTGYYRSDCFDVNTTPGDGLDLAPAGWTSGIGRGISCTNDTVCQDAFGESFAPCHMYTGICSAGVCITGFLRGNPCAGNADCAAGFCDAGYIDADGTGRPDSYCAAPEGCNFGGVAMGTCNATYFAGSGSTLGTADGGFVYHGGTLVLDIPAGAKGKYTVQLNMDETFIDAPGTPPQHIPSLRENGFIVNLVTGSCCFGIGTPDAGCVDDCITRSDCGDDEPSPFVFTPDGRCPPIGPDCSHFLGACCDVDPSGPCTDDIVLSDCDCATCTWHKLQTCAEIECSPTPIPTISEWGLVVLTLLLLIGAKVLFTRGASSA